MTTTKCKTKGNRGRAILLKRFCSNSTVNLFGFVKAVDEILLSIQARRRKNKSEHLLLSISCMSSLLEIVKEVTE